MMKGSYNITVRSKKINYDFTIRRKITVIRGDSGTGKTTLTTMIIAANQGAGAILNCKVPCIVMTNEFWQYSIPQIENSIIFIDEQNSFVTSEEFASVIKRTNNYYVLITRANLDNLPFSVDEIYKMHHSNKYNYLVPLFEYLHDVFVPDCIITEDSRAGFDFFSNVCNKGQGLCYPAGGNSKIVSALEELALNNRNILIVIDGAAYGSYFEKLQKYTVSAAQIYNNKYFLFMPESFEYLLLSCDMFIGIKEVHELLIAPENYITSDYFSWEIFFDEFLRNITKDTLAAYNKRKLNICYLEDCCCKGKRCGFYVRGEKERVILNKIDNIDFTHIKTLGLENAY